MTKEALWVAIAVGLIVLLGIFAVVQGGTSLLSLSSTAERWEFLMRQLRR